MKVGVRPRKGWLPQAREEVPLVHAQPGGTEWLRGSCAVKYTTNSPLGAQATLGSWLKMGKISECAVRRYAPPGLSETAWTTWELLAHALIPPVRHSFCQ